MNQTDFKEITNLMLNGKGEEEFKLAMKDTANHKKMVQFLQENQNSKYAVYFLARLYQIGIGVEKDTRQAVKLYKIADGMGCNDSIRLLSQMYKYGYDCRSKL